MKVSPRGELIAKLAASLGYDKKRSQKLIKTLRKESIISYHFLSGIVLSGRERLAIEVLISLTIMEVADKPENELFFVVTEELDSLEHDLYLLVDAFKFVNTNKKTVKSDEQELELAWTLPQYLGYQSELPPLSLAGLIKRTITLAESRLIFVSPFLEMDGMKLLSAPLKAASDRGVNLTLISHQMDVPNSPNNDILLFLKDNFRSVTAYTYNSDFPKDKYLLLHAKIVLADKRYAVISSANLTKYGLESHLEIGVGFSGSAPVALADLVEELLKSHLVSLVT